MRKIQSADAIKSQLQQFLFFRNFNSIARVAELADALDLGSSGLTPVGVRVPPFALIVSYIISAKSTCV